MYVAVGLCTCSACLWYVGHSGMDSGVSSLVAGGHGTPAGISQRLSSQGELLESSWADGAEVFTAVSTSGRRKQ